MEEKLRILMLEDVPADAELIEHELRKGGIAFSSKRVETREDFIKELESFSPNLILADYKLPSFDGISALTIVQEKCPDMPFIFVTGSLGEEMAIETLKMGATDYVLKERLSRLVPAVNRAIQEVKKHTERKRIEEALRESEEKYRTLFEDSKDVVYISTTGGRFLDINPAGVELFGYDSKEELLMIDIAKDLYLNPDYRKKFIETMEQLGFVKDYELFMKKKNGEILTLLSTATPLKDKEGKLIGYRGIIRDVTEHKKLEQQLLHAQKMEAIGLLTGGIAHDFNNILTAIIGYGNIIKMKTKEGSPLRHNVEQILVSSERAASLIRSLLTFSRKQMIDLKPLRLNESIKDIEKLLLRIIGEDIELRSMLSNDELTVIADRGQVEQLLMNLVINARDAMPKGGILTIKTEIIEIDEKYIKVHGYGSRGTYALIAVSDSGIGMDEKTIERIFEPFFTTKEFGKGTGLGLSIVYGIVKQHDGFIKCCSKQEKGTTFNIYLPITKSEAIEGKKAEAAVPKLGTETVLIAEDDPEVRNIIKISLESYGYTVIEAVDGEDAVNKFKENKDNIQLLIFDGIMPKKSGIEAYKDIKKMKQNIKAILLSGYSPDSIQIRESIKDKSFQFISKPFSPNDLLRKMREVLDR